MNVLCVAANNNENTDWVTGVRDWIISINTDYQPKGREAYTYLTWIIDHYDDEWDEVVFTQGDPFKHDVDFIQHLSDPAIRYYSEAFECNPKGAPHAAEWTDLHSWCSVLNLPLQESYVFVGGAQYRVTREQIQTRSLEFYKALLYLTFIEGNMSPWCIERLYPIIWNINL